MPSCEDTLWEVYWCARFMQSGREMINTYSQSAFDFFMAGDYPNAIEALIYCTYGTMNALSRYMGQGDWDDGGPIWYYLKNCIEGGEAEVTMQTLINTMLTANPDQVQYFVGLVDAYRQSVWNRPFNKPFFTALAKGFEQWE